MKLLDNRTGNKACYDTLLSVKRSRNYYKFKFIAYHSTFNSYSNKYNASISNGDVCEIFIKYGKENHYYEVEVAPNGTIFLADVENINDKFKPNRLDDCFIKASAKILKDRYIVKIIIPRNKIHTKKLEFNAYRIDTDGKKKNKHLFALHPTLCGTFHKIKSIY